MRLFAQHPDQWALLAREPERVPQAVQKVLRHEPITPFTARILTADRSGKRLLTFGAGIHFCLGVNLATAELEEALRFLAPRMSGLHLTAPAQFGTIQGIYGLDRLELAWTPDATTQVRPG